MTFATRLATPLLAITLLAPAALAGPAQPVQHGEVQVAQACGWYAISVCSKTYNEAANAADRFGGYVIDTNSSSYPNFRGGWFCAVIGPKSHQAAKSTAGLLKKRGASSAYAKSAC